MSKKQLYAVYDVVYLTINKLSVFGNVKDTEEAWIAYNLHYIYAENKDEAIKVFEKYSKKINNVGNINLYGNGFRYVAEYKMHAEHYSENLPLHYDKYDIFKAEYNIRACDITDEDTIMKVREHMSATDFKEWWFDNHNDKEFPFISLTYDKI